MRCFWIQEIGGIAAMVGDMGIGDCAESKPAVLRGLRPALQERAGAGSIGDSWHF
jgi:hypothetical protein